MRNRSRAVGRRVRQISRTLARRTGEAREQMIALNAEAGHLLRRSAKEAKRLAEAARSKARGRGAQAKLRAAEAIEQLAERCERIARQTTPRLRGEKISDRIVSIADPDARPIRKGKAGKPNEFGYVAQICEVTQNTKPGTRGFVLPAPSGVGNLSENTLLPETAAELASLELAPRAVVAPKSSSPRSNRTGSSSPAARNLARHGPNDDCAATEPGSRGGYPTSSVATA
ncbi:MAG TPA: hypothetical protein VIY71_05430 [Solirubrobacterales bacterium]